MSRFDYTDEIVRPELTEMQVANLLIFIETSLNSGKWSHDIREPVIESIDVLEKSLEEGE